MKTGEVRNRRNVIHRITWSRVSGKIVLLDSHWKSYKQHLMYDFNHTEVTQKNICTRKETMISTQTRYSLNPQCICETLRVISRMLEGDVQLKSMNIIDQRNFWFTPRSFLSLKMTNIKLVTKGGNEYKMYPNCKEYIIRSFHRCVLFGLHSLHRSTPFPSLG